MSNTKSKDYREICEKLDQFRYALAAYCHDENCKEVYECPYHNEKCRQRLGLDTSLAWEASYLVWRVWWAAKTNMLALEEIERIYYVLCVLRSIVSRHFEKFSELVGLLNGAIYCIYLLYKNEKEGNQTKKTNEGGAQ